jgi:hypothetical protein
LINQKLSTITATKKYNAEAKKSESMERYMIGAQVFTGCQHLAIIYVELDIQEVTTIT